MLQIKSLGKYKIAITKDVIVINAYGLLNNSNKGFTGAKTISLNTITGIQYKSPSFTTGYLQLIILGREVAGGVDAAMKDENTITFLDRDEPVMLQLKDYLESIIIRGSASVQTPQGTNLDEIKKLKELLDIGAISQDEFNIKKKNYWDYKTKNHLTPIEK